ncbi:MAG: hypothetical protein JW706_12140 [Opitutales bacterium]|nr:hypothetical protein [Opitutales bacterium]
MVPLMVLRHQRSMLFDFSNAGCFPVGGGLARVLLLAMIVWASVGASDSVGAEPSRALEWKPMESPFEVIDQIGSGEGLYFSGVWRMEGGIPEEVKALMPFDPEILTRLDDAVERSRFFGLNRFVFEVCRDRRKWDASVSDNDVWMRQFLTEGERLEAKEGEGLRMKAGSLWRPSFDLTCMDVRTESGDWLHPDAAVLDRVLGKIDQEIGLRVESSVLKLDCFSRVLGMKTAECALTVSNHLSDDGERLIVSVYSFQFLHSLPPGFMGGFDLIQRQAKQRFEHVIESLECGADSTDGKIVAEDAPVLKPDAEVVMSVL